MNMASPIKPMASLSSGLLARKGEARPAMRSQWLADRNAPIEDLGWSDMGEAMAIDAPPPVVLQREALAREIETQPIAPGTLAQIGQEVSARKGRTAFTLRLDAERHLRLRLASAVVGRSAQLVVTEALDRYLNSVVEVDALAKQLRAPGND